MINIIKELVLLGFKVSNFDTVLFNLYIDNKNKDILNNQIFSSKNFNELFVKKTENSFCNIYIKNSNNLISILNNFLYHIEDNLLNNIGNDIIIDHFGVNLGKEVHLGHLRSLFIGDLIKNIYRACGYNAISESHLGDFGLNISLLIYFCKQKGLSIEKSCISYLHSLYVQANEMKENIKDKSIDYILELQKAILNDDFNFLKFFYDFKNNNIDYLNKITSKFGMKIENWKGETCYLKECNVIINDVIKNCDVSFVKNAIFLNKFNCFLTRGNGTFLYLLTDLAALKQRYKDNVSKIFYITDKRQHVHFNNLFSIFDSIYENNIEKCYIGYGFITDELDNPLKTKISSNSSFLLEDIKNSIKNFFNLNKKQLNDNAIYGIIRAYDLKFNFEKNYSLKNITSDLSDKSGLYIIYTYARLFNTLPKNFNYYNDKLFKINYTNTQIFYDDFNEIFVGIFRTLFSIFQACKDKNFKMVFDFCLKFTKIINKIYSQNKVNFSNNNQVTLIILNFFNIMLKILNINKLHFLQ